MKSAYSLIVSVLIGLVLKIDAVRAVESLEERWRAVAVEDGGSFAELTQGNTERGLAYNAMTDRVLVVSRAGGLQVVGFVGADLQPSYPLNTTGIGGGVFPLNMIGVADDGAIYACNLVLASGSTTFRVYRWEVDEDDAIPEVVFEGDPAGVDEFGVSLGARRWGDSMAVRGSGTSTQILVGSRASSKLAILTTQDGDTFESTPLEVAGIAQGNLGVAFGAGNTAYSKESNQPLRYFSFDLMAGTATLEASFVSLPNSGRPIAVDAASQRLAMLVTNVTPPLVQLYDISEPTLSPVLADVVELNTSNPNSNATGAAAFGVDSLFVLQTNNGIAAYDVVDDNLAVPPVIETQPFSQTVIAGGGVAFTVVISGTPPFDFQWQKDNIDLVGEVGSTLEILGVAEADAGSYTVVVTNSAGEVTSNSAVLTVIPRVDGDIAAVKWEVGVDDRPYLANDSAQRGMAVNPTNGNVVLVSRTGGTQMRVLDGSDGSDLHAMEVAAIGVVAGATFQLSMVGVAADGAVYASNLSLTGDQYRIYRWPNDSPGAFSSVAFDAQIAGNPTPTQRLGDTLAVRGSGVTTQILAATRTTTEVVLFTTADGENFTPTVLNVSGASGNFGLGLTFGAGNTFWGNTQGGSLYRCAFDPVAGTASVLAAYTTADFPGSIGPISVSPQYGLLAGISSENPDNIQIFDISDSLQPPQLLDLEFLSSDNANINGTGALAFGSLSVVGLGTNNGLSCLSLDVEEVVPAGPFFSNVRTIADNRIQFTLNGEIGRTYRIEDSPDLSEDLWDAVQEVTLSVAPSQEFTFSTLAGRYFYRAVPVDD